MDDAMRLDLEKRNSRRSFTLLLCAAVAVSACGGPGTGRSGGASGAVRIMAIGDSITRATCWRDLLWQQLQQNNPGGVDFVGTLQADYGCGVSGFDPDNQGYSSSLVTEVVAGVTNARTCDPYCPNMSNLQTAFASAKPQVVLIHWGTNDVWNGKSSSSIAGAYSTVIDALRAANPSVVVLLAQVIPMNVTGATCSGCSCASCSTAIPALNATIATFAAGKATAQSPVIVVDQYTGFDATADTRDGVHPNTQGSQKMASKWAAALTANQLVH
jgi:lysophospholipase L1-like esterase